MAAGIYRHKNSPLRFPGKGYTFVLILPKIYNPFQFVIIAFSPEQSRVTVFLLTGSVDSV